VLPLLESDLLTIMQATTNGTLTEDMVRFSDKSACCVVMASNGYPEKYETGFEITIPEEYENSVFVAGAKLENGKLLTAGGRVLGAVALGDTLKDAINASYKLAENEGHQTVGTKVNISHLRACRPGTELTATAEILEFEGRRIEFAVKVEDVDGLIGKDVYLLTVILVVNNDGRLNALINLKLVNAEAHILSENRCFCSL
jgi:predicted thioesterase